MSTSNITIGQLIPHVFRIQEETREETERVIGYSRTQAPKASDVLNIAYRIFVIRRKWRELVSRQSTMVEILTSVDFTSVEPANLKEIAVSLEGAVASGRTLLNETSQLGSESRFWWRNYLRKFGQQIEHVDSIAESLRLECEPDAIRLLASAASRVVKRQHCFALLRVL